MKKYLAFVWAWLKEFFARFTHKSPAYFNVWTMIGASASFITGLPELLQSANIEIPTEWQALENKIVAYCGLIIILMSKQTVNRGGITVDKTTGDVQRIEPPKLPYTHKKDLEVLEKAADAEIKNMDNPNPAA